MLLVLDLYILAKLDKGLQTPYDLQREAGLSLGATVPALRRLSKQKLVTRAEGLTATKRPKHAYTLTEAGKEQAESGWKEYLQIKNSPADLDALLRVADIALQYGARKPRLSDFLRSAAKHKLDFATQLAAGVGRIPGAPFSYRAMRAQVEIERLQAEERALTAIADGLIEKRGKRTAEKPKIKGFIPGQMLFTESELGWPKSPRKHSE